MMIGHDLERLKVQYVSSARPLADIAAERGRSLGWLQHLARRCGWPTRTADAPVKRGRKSVARSVGELQRMRAVVEAGALALDDIAARFKCGRETLADLIRAHGWHDPRAGRVPRKQPTTAVRGPKPKTQKQILVERRAEDVARDRSLYGTANDVADVDFLRRCGFIVNREGPGVRVGNTLCTFEQMREKAARERRLAGVSA